NALHLRSSDVGQRACARSDRFGRRSGASSRTVKSGVKPPHSRSNAQKKSGGSKAAGLELNQSNRESLRTPPYWSTDRPYLPEYGSKQFLRSDCGQSERVSCSHPDFEG